jgi:hypothetical protein
MIVLSLALALVCAADHPVPAWVPRGAQVGLLLATDASIVAPDVRLQWDFGLVEQPRNDLVVIAQLGTAIGAVLPAGMTAHYQHVAMIGLGYRATYDLFHWGFQFGLGPVWYRAAFTRGGVNPFESRVLGYAEGRLQVGLKLQKHLIVGLYFGYASPWTYSPNRYPGNTYVGGLNLGVFADWR